ncbi:MAG: hypothetical protein FGM27_01960 [Candidatus Omnitrophica bacterium]|nr:hypothetical protein [Candidatus Omnitrophota bacterium]
MNARFSSFLLLACMIAAAGCAPKADPRKPVEEVRAEAAAMNMRQLESAARSYAKAAKARRDKLSKATEELKKLPPKDLLSEKSRAARERASALGTEAGELMARHQIYVQKLGEIGGNPDKVKIPE